MRHVEWSGVRKEPGTIQHGCMFANMVGEDYDTVYIYNTEDEARKDVKSYIKRGTKAKYVTRTVPDWEDQN